MTEVDARGVRAGQALRRAAQVDAEAWLHDLQRTRRHRARVRNGVVLAGVVVLAATSWSYRPGQTERPGSDRGSVAIGPRLTLGETEVDSDRSASGARDAVAVLREGQPAVVRVGVAGSTDQHVVWSAPTAHELGDRNLPWPAAVEWAPDGSLLAIVVAQERGRVDDIDDPVELTLVTVGADGAGRRIAGDVGTCLCRDTRPVLSWTGANQLEVLIPDGPDRGVQRRTLQ
jgi:hypothetical protein